MTATTTYKVSPLPRCRTTYSTSRGTMVQGTLEKFFTRSKLQQYRKKIDLIFTSPPFPLNLKKTYGNYQGAAYLQWLTDFAPLFREILKPRGSIVIELGNAWEPGKPTMSTLPIRALLGLQERGGFSLCQQFIYYNPAKLPSPAHWVNIKRIRVKDAFTHIWWMSPSENPKANNRKVLREYSPAMKNLLKSGTYNAGTRPSGHNISSTSFLRNNSGAIPSNVLIFSNTKSSDDYLKYCHEKHLPPNPSRMPEEIPEFFIKLLTKPHNLIFDPFAGSNTTGAVAERLKRRWLSIEPLREYVDGSFGRFINQKDE